MELLGKNIIVTGGTSGIGRGIALECATQGANVLVAGRNIEKGRSLEQEAKALGGTVIFQPCDVSKVVECKALVKKAIDLFKSIDGLVNNAGIFPRQDPFTITEDEYDSVMDTNVKGTYFCSFAAIEWMRDNGGGSIVNIGSINGFSGDGPLSVYSISKGAIHTLSRHIAQNYAQYKIRSNWITVGWVATEKEVSRYKEIGLGLEDLEKEALEYIPSGRMQTALDNAQSVVFLLSDKSSQVNGTDIHVTGGKYF